MGLIKDENTYTIHGWMLNKLHLEGTALNVYAIIFGFSQDGESEFYGSRRYLAEFTGKSLPTIDSALEELCDKGLIIKTSETRNFITTNKYRINVEVFENFTGSKETLQGVKKLGGGCKETLPNNKEDNKNNILYTNRFQKPTIEEIKAYCEKRNNSVDPEQFFNFYESKGWKVGNQPMKNWQSAVITWERRNNKPQEYHQKNYTNTELNNLFDDVGDLLKELEKK